MHTAAAEILPPFFCLPEQMNLSCLHPGSGII
jgi:hypothetical protein